MSDSGVENKARWKLEGLFKRHIRRYLFHCVVVRMRRNTDGRAGWESREEEGQWQSIQALYRYFASL
jgi:hypothetical protein